MPSSSPRPSRAERKAAKLVERADWPALLALLSTTPSLVTMSRPPHGRTLLHDASLTGKTAAVDSLLSLGANPNACTVGLARPLHAAARGNRPLICKMLVERGAEVDARGDGGETALHVAAWGGRLEVMKVLVEVGANVHVRNNRGEKPVDLMRRTTKVVCAAVDDLERRMRECDDIDAEGTASMSSGF